MWSRSTAEAIALVGSVPELMRTATSDASGHERSPDGSWSVAEYVCHVGDNLRQWAERVQGARLDGQRSVSGYDPDTLAEARGYASVPLGAARWSLGISDEHWMLAMTAAVNEGIELEHKSRGIQGAGDIVLNNAHDCFHHLFDIERLLA